MVSSAPSTTQKEVVDEVYGFIKVYSDGTVERPPFPGGYLPACPEFVKGVASKDVTIDADLGLWARLFLPQGVASSGRKCPIVLHFHGGGLCSGTPAATSSHRFCSKMSAESESIWVSIDYRLAPEHRLPAAYEDAHAAFMWLSSQSDMQPSCQGPHAERLHTHDVHRTAQEADAKHEENGHVTTTCFCMSDPRTCGAEAKHAAYGDHTNGHVENLHTCTAHTKGHLRCLHGHDTNGLFLEDLRRGLNNSLCKLTPEPWLHRHADFSKCFLVGESSGGAIVHYLTMRIATHTYSSIQVRGLLLIHAAFLIHGVYDESHDPKFERRPDTYRLLCLPSVGAAWDHPLVNPLHAHAPSIDGITLPPSIVAVADQDKFCVPGKYYAHAMKQRGHVVELHVTEGQGHCFYLYHPKSKEAESFFKHLAAFMHQRCTFQGHQSCL